MSRVLHDDELAIDLRLVRRLVDGLDDTYADLPLTPLAASGSSNALFRLGEDLVVRLPRQPGGSESIAKEARWAGVLAPALPVAVPHVVHVGAPSAGYPELWSVVRWLPGDVPDVVDRPAGRPALADDLAALIGALYAADVPTEATTDPALHWYRCDPVQRLDADVRTALEACRDLPGLDLDLPRAERIWDDALRIPAPPPVTRWLHADLVAENLLVREGRLAAVLDFGGLAVGDPSVDLVAAWELFDTGDRERLRTTVAVDDTTGLNARAWALAMGAVHVPVLLDHDAAPLC